MTDVNEMMGFDPQNLDVFQEKPQSNFDANVYKTNPKDSKSESGNYISRIRVVYNPSNPRKSIVHQATYYLQDENGGLLVRSKLGDGNKACCLFQTWKKLWFSGDEAKKAWAKEMFNKNESNWVLVQILEDDNKPELVGKFMVMKLPQAIYDKMTAKMNPSAEKKQTPVPVMDYLIGLPLSMEVQPGPDDPKQPSRKQREISYTLCDFEADYTPITKVDGTPLFDDSEIELIDAYVEARKEMLTGKTEAKRNAGTAKFNEIKPQMTPLYQKALDYVKENAVDLEAECSFHEWDEATTARVNAWIENVLAMRDPKAASSSAEAASAAEGIYGGGDTTPIAADDPFGEMMNGAAEQAPAEKPDDDLPF